jgi:Mor family transcriptional regulator
MTEKKKHIGTEEENHDLFDDSLSAELLEHLPDIAPETKSKWPRDLVALLDMYKATLKRMGYPEEEAEKITYAMLADLSTYCGGRYIYLPKADALETAIRDVKIYRDWSKDNVTPEALAGKYKLSLQHVYRVVKEQRRYHLNRVQMGLF